MTGRGERLAQRADDQSAHQAGIAEAHLGLGGMDVDVDRLARSFEEQRHHRMPVAREQILIGAAHRADQEFVAHRPTVDEEILIARGRAVEGRQADEAGEREPFARGRDRKRVVGEVAAHDRRQALAPRIIAGEVPARR